MRSAGQVKELVNRLISDWEVFGESHRVSLQATVPLTPSPPSLVIFVVGHYADALLEGCDHGPPGGVTWRDLFRPRRR